MLASTKGSRALHYRDFSDFNLVKVMTERLPNEVVRYGYMLILGLRSIMLSLILTRWYLRRLLMQLSGRSLLIDTILLLLWCMLHVNCFGKKLMRRKL